MVRTNQEKAAVCCWEKSECEEILLKLEESQEKIRNFLSSMQINSLMPNKQLYSFHILVKTREPDFSC